MLPFAADIGYDTGILIETVLFVFSAMVNQKIFFFIYEFQNIFFASLKIGRQLNGRGRTGFLAETAINAAGEIDSKPGGISPAVFFGG